MEKKYVITGATGNIGGRIAKTLLEQNKSVRITTRHLDNATELAALGAEVFVGDPSDARFLKQAFQGADAVFAMIPPFLAADDYRAYQNDVGAAQAEAIRAASIKYVVNLSSVGAHDGERSGVIKGLHDQEQRLNAMDDVNVVHLRPAYFMENLFMGIETVTQGFVGSALPGDLAIPMVATLDIADAATDILLGESIQGKRIQYLLGSADVSMEEIAELLGAHLGKALNFVRYSFEDTRGALLGAGLSASGADLLVEMYRNIEADIITPTQPRDASSTTATSIQQFVQILATAVPTPA